VHESTLRRWLAEPEFAKAYERARSQVLQATGTLLRNKALAAVLVLGEIMASDQSKPMTRVAAARGVLEFCFRSVEMDGLQEIRETLVRVEDKLDRRKR